MDHSLQSHTRSTQLMQSFWQLQKSIMAQVKETAADNDLSVPQFAIMMLMQRHTDMPQKKLQARTHFPKSTLSHAIEGLVQADVLTRTHVAGNRREIVLSLSEQGKTLLETITRQENGVHSRFKAAVDSFTEDEFNQLLAMHEQMIAYFDGGDDI